MAPGVAHRPGAFKQSNKSHNTGKHRSKGKVSKENRGRVAGKLSGGGSKKAGLVISKADRRNRAVQLRRAARAEVAAAKRAVGGAGGGPPLLLTVIPLYSEAVPNAVLDQLAVALPDTETSRTATGALQLAVPRLKARLTVVAAPAGSLQAALDLCKVADSVVFLVCGQEGWDQHGDSLLSAVMAQGLPSTPLFLATGLETLSPPKRQEAKKLLAKALNKKLPVEKVWGLAGEGEAAQLVRAVLAGKRKGLVARDRRAYMLGEKVDWEEDMLAVTGYIRGAALSCDRLVHIPGLGDCQVERVVTTREPLRGAGRETEMFETREVGRAGPDRQQLDCENTPDGLEGEQTWPTEQELLEAEQLQSEVRTMRRVPRGTSEYQAAWILDEVEQDGEGVKENLSGEDSEDEDMENEVSEAEEEDSGNEEELQSEFDTQSVAMTEEIGDYDAKHVNFAAEVDELEKLKAARLESMFPDEVDTPLELPARVRFQKYRGLKSFRTSAWDAKENLPLDYARIWQFENFDRTRRRVLSEETTGAEVGWYVTVFISGVGRHLVTPGPLVLTALLPHEHRLSVVNMAVRRHQAGPAPAPIPAKSRLVFQLGWRRFASCPLFSQHTNGNKHKAERWFRDGNIVMTTFAPITFPPASVLVFQEDTQEPGRLSLLATGSLLSCDPNRLVVKRTVLSGHPFKVHKRVCTVRFMFFNREDIEWFKPVELRTKTGRRGHIKEPLGTHGHMKCMFDGPVSQQDTVLMNLYKRVFPKWTYDPYVASEVPPNQHEEVMEEC